MRWALRRMDDRIAESAQVRCDDSQQGRLDDPLGILLMYAIDCEARRDVLDEGDVQHHPRPPVLNAHRALRGLLSAACRGDLSDFATGLTYVDMVLMWHTGPPRCCGVELGCTAAHQWGSEVGPVSAAVSVTGAGGGGSAESADRLWRGG